MAESPRAVAGRSFSQRKRLEQVKNVVRVKINHDRVPLLEKFVEKEELAKEQAGGAGQEGQLLKDDFFACFQECGVAIHEKDMDVLCQKFGDYRGLINFRRFYSFLDVLPPQDHIDPGLHRDRLPQPFRMLSKILDDCILEPAWDMIQRRNPHAAEPQIAEEATQGEDETSDRPRTKGSHARKVHRRALDLAARKLEDNKNELKQLQGRKQRVISCSQYYEKQIDNVSCTAISKCGRFSFLGTSDGKILGIADETKLVRQGTPVFQDEAPITHIECVNKTKCASDQGNQRTEQDPDVVILLVLSSGFKGDQKTLYKSRNSAESEQEAASQESSFLRVVEFSFLRPAGSEFTMLSSVTELNDKIVQLWACEEGKRNAWVGTSNQTDEPTVTRSLRVGWYCADCPRLGGDNEESQEALPPNDILKFSSLSITPVPAKSAVEGQGADDEDKETKEDQDEENKKGGEEVGQINISPIGEFGLSPWMSAYSTEFSPFQVLYVHGNDKALVAQSGSSLLSQLDFQGPNLESHVPLWMPAGVLCHATLVTEKGIELAAFGLSDGTTVVWNIRSNTVRAILRRQKSAVSTVQFIDLEKGSKEATNARSDSSVQVLCGCTDGKLRLYQLTSDAPAAAAILPRVFEKEESERELLAGSPTFQEESRTATLCGAVFVSELSEMIVSETVEFDGAEQPKSTMHSLKSIQGTPLWIACFESGSKASSEVKVFDLEAARQVGRFEKSHAEEDGQELAEWKADNTRLAMYDDAVIIMEHQGDEENSAITLRSFPLGRYVPAFYPTISQACGLSAEEIDMSGPLPAVGVFGKGKKRMAQIRQNARHLISNTSALERCNPDGTLTHLLQDTPAANSAEDDFAGRFAQLFSPKNGADGDLGVSFSRAGLILAKLKRKGQQAGKNVINPTRLEESLLSSEPSQRLAQFEARRRSTRQAREESLQKNFQKWAS